MAAAIEVVVQGEAFLAAYTRGDNRLVVATDTMKNFIHAAARTARPRRWSAGCTTSAAEFLTEYPHMDRLTISADELPFPAALVPADDAGSAQSDASSRATARPRHRVAWSWSATAAAA